MTVYLSYEGGRVAEAGFVACWDSIEDTEGAPGESLRTSARLLFGRLGVHRVACLCVGRAPLLLFQDAHGRWLDVSGRRVIVRQSAPAAKAAPAEAAAPALVLQPAL